MLDVQAEVLTVNDFGANIDPERGKIIGLDINPAMVERALSQFPRSDYPHADFQEVDALEIFQFMNDYRLDMGLNPAPNKVVGNFTAHFWNTRELERFFRGTHGTTVPDMRLGMIIPAEGIF